MVYHIDDKGLAAQIIGMSNDRMGSELANFALTMAQKLEKNSHKDKVELPDVPRLLELLMGEVGEFVRQYMEDPTDSNARKECADIANFAFLISTVLPK